LQKIPFFRLILDGLWEFNNDKDAFNELGGIEEKFNICQNLDKSHDTKKIVAKAIGTSHGTFHKAKYYGWDTPCNRFWLAQLPC